MSDLMHSVVHPHRSLLVNIIDVGECGNRLSAQVYQQVIARGLNHFAFQFAVCDGNLVQRFSLENRQSDAHWREDLTAFVQATSRPRAAYGLPKVSGKLYSYKNTSLESLDNRIFYLYFISDSNEQVNQEVADSLTEEFLKFIGEKEESVTVSQCNLVAAAARAFGRPLMPETEPVQPPYANKEE